MRVFLCFDDTDTKDSDRGTGRLARWFGAALPTGVKLEGIVRQQLPRLPGIPFTSNNSSACVVLQAPQGYDTASLIGRAADHIAAHFIEGSDPGLCVVTEDQPEVLSSLLAFSRRASSRVVTQREAHEAAVGAHLAGHGGTEDGVIGAAAGVGLTYDGWQGRFIELAGVDLRALPDPATVAILDSAGIKVLGIDRDALMPAPEHEVVTHGWVRPRLWGGRPVLAVTWIDEDRWEVVGKKWTAESYRISWVSGPATSIDHRPEFLDVLGAGTATAADDVDAQVGSTGKLALP